MKTIVKNLLICLLFSIGCQNNSNSKDVFYVPGPQPEPMPTNDCAKACENLRVWNCDLGFQLDRENKRCQNTGDDPLTTCVSCEVFCEETIKNYVWLDTDCVAKMQNLTPPKCDEIETCAIRQDRSPQ